MLLSASKNWSRFLVFHNLPLHVGLSSFLHAMLRHAFLLVDNSTSELTCQDLTEFILGSPYCQAPATSCFVLCRILLCLSQNQETSVGKVAWRKYNPIDPYSVGYLHIALFGVLVDQPRSTSPNILTLLGPCLRLTTECRNYFYYPMNASWSNSTTFRRCMRGLRLGLFGPVTSTSSRTINSKHSRQSGSDFTSHAVV